MRLAGRLNLYRLCGRGSGQMSSIRSGSGPEWREILNNDAATIDGWKKDFIGRAPRLALRVLGASRQYEVSADPLELTPLARPARTRQSSSTWIRFVAGIWIQSRDGTCPWRWRPSGPPRSP